MKKVGMAFNAVLDGIPDRVYIASREYTIEYMNDAMADWVGCHDEGASCFKVIFGLNERCTWCRMSPGESGSYHELSVAGSLGDRSYHVIDSPVLNADGTVSKLTILRDVTDLKERECQLAQCRVMETLWAFSGEFAHDFNNILSPVIGLSELLLEDMPDDSPETKYLSQILKAGLRAKDMIRNILVFSHPTGNQGEICFMQSMVKGLIRQVAEDLPPSVRIIQDFQAGLSLVKADAGDVHHIILSVLDHAVRSMDSCGGTVGIALRDSDGSDVPDALVNDDPEGSYVRLSVCLPCRLKEDMTDVLVSEKRSGDAKGTHLSDVYERVGRIGGHLAIEDDPVKGGALHVYLPRLTVSPVSLMDDRDYCEAFGAKLFEAIRESLN